MKTLKNLAAIVLALSTSISLKAQEEDLPREPQEFTIPVKSSSENMLRNLLQESVAGDIFTLVRDSDRYLWGDYQSTNHITIRSLDGSGFAGGTISFSSGATGTLQGLDFNGKSDNPYITVENASLVMGNCTAYGRGVLVQFTGNESLRASENTMYGDEGIHTVGFNVTGKPKELVATLNTFGWVDSAFVIDESEPVQLMAKTLAQEPETNQISKYLVNNTIFNAYDNALSIVNPASNVNYVLVNNLITDAKVGAYLQGIDNTELLKSNAFNNNEVDLIMVKTQRDSLQVDPQYTLDGWGNDGSVSSNSPLIGQGYYIDGVTTYFDATNGVQMLALNNGTWIGSKKPGNIEQQIEVPTTTSFNLGSTNLAITLDNVVMNKQYAVQGTVDLREAWSNEFLFRPQETTYTTTIPIKINTPIHFYRVSDGQ